METYWYCTKYKLEFRKNTKKGKCNTQVEVNKLEFFQKILISALFEVEIKRKINLMTFNWNFFENTCLAVGVRVRVCVVIQIFLEQTCTTCGTRAKYGPQRQKNVHSDCLFDRNTLWIVPKTIQMWPLDVLIKI